MNVGQAVAAIIKQEGCEYLFCYPTTKLIDEAALVGVRPIVVRQERTGIHMADAYSRLATGDRFGVFAMQHGPGAENSFGGVAQAYGESVPILVMPQGYPRRLSGVHPNFSSARSMRDVAKSVEALQLPSEAANVMRRAFSQLKNGRGGPVVVEVPADVWNLEIEAPFDYQPAPRSLFGPDPQDVARAVDLIERARSPVIYAGQGVHYSRAWEQLKALAEQMNVPVLTTLPGKSAFPEDHPLSLGSGGLSYSAPVKNYLHSADVIIGIGCSFTETVFAVPMPEGPKIIHNTIDPAHLNKDVSATVGLVGDAGLALSALSQLLTARGYKGRDRATVASEIAAAKLAWIAEWRPKLTSDATPLSPYRVIADLLKATDDEEVIITNDAGRPRDQLTPFWLSKSPLSFIGWGKTTHLGYGLGLAMGAKLARPDNLCINVWGDAAIGFTGMDLETAVREKIPVLSILFNNGGMATEHKNIPAAIQLFDAANITGNYCELAQALGAHAERVTRPEEIIPAIARAIVKTKEGIPALLEFITAQETEFPRG